MATVCFFVCNIFMYYIFDIYLKKMNLFCYQEKSFSLSSPPSHICGVSYSYYFPRLLPILNHILHVFITQKNTCKNIYKMFIIFPTSSMYEMLPRVIVI